VKKILKLLALLLLPVLVGFAVSWRFSHSLPRQLAQARSALGTREGSALLEELVQDHSDNPDVFFLHARQQRLNGQTSQALVSLQRAAELGWPPAQVERERLLVRAANEFRQVEPALQALLDADPGDREVLLTLGFGWTRLQNPRKAEALVDAVLSRDPNDGLAHLLRGRIQLQKSQPHEARADLEQALRLGAGQYYAADARLLLAQCLLDLSEFEEALQLYRQCQAEEPDNPSVHLGTGRCLWHLHHWPEAAEAFQTVLRLNSDNLDALSQLAYLQEEQGQLSGALELLEKAARLDPTWYDLSFRIAHLLREMGQPERAAEYEKRAEAVKHDRARPRPSAPGGNPYTGDEPPASRNAPMP
jgi:tetratricopeptide (TPR) repeat protein